MNTELTNIVDIASPRMSPRYKTVKTNMVAARFKELGFVVDEIKHVKKRNNSAFGKHLVRLSHPTLLSSTHNDVKLQLIVTNSFDGSSVFTMQLGFFRFVCSNGMVVGETLHAFKRKHIGNIIEEIDSGIERIVAQTKDLEKIIGRLKSTVLTDSQVKDFERKASALRLKSGNLTYTVRRQEDEGMDLFTVYNRIQEDIIRGGAKSVTGDKIRRLRPISSVTKLKELNEQLFDLALEFAA